MNLARAFLDHNLPDRADKVALRTVNRDYTFREMVEWSCRYGNLLRDAGVLEEDRVLLALNDGRTSPPPGSARRASAPSSP